MADNKGQLPTSLHASGTAPAATAGEARDGQAAEKRSPLDAVLHRITFGLVGRPPATKEGVPPTHTSRVDGTREIVETIVFVVVLVLMLKSFVAEAFVIPAGSMADTLYGYQKILTCEKCRYQFPVNCSQEVDPQDGIRVFVRSATCQNCRWQFPPEKMVEEREVKVRDPRTGGQYIEVETIPKQESHTGDRVLVAKFLYDLPWKSPERLDVVVFKFPKEPQKNYVPMNYIKRLVGLGGETIAIHYGNLYVLRPENGGPKYNDRPVAPEDLWQEKYMHRNEAVGLFPDKFEIIRKPPDKILSMRRLVYDNDYPASDLKDQPRWVPARDNNGWTEVAERRGFQCAPQTEVAWLRYRHIVRDHSRPSLITDFMSYNSGSADRDLAEHWVGDLILECQAHIDKAQGQLVLELSRGPDRFRASWQLDSGVCTLRRVKGHLLRAAPADDAGEELASAATAVKAPGTYRLRFANVDDRLVVWVNNDLPFGDGVNYLPSDKHGPYENDLQPASIGARGASVAVAKLKLWRDTYYTPPPGDGDPMFKRWDDPDEWKPLRELTPNTFYVQPGHYLCMGDNSPQSYDGRSWGTVPERLMLGRALVVYYPFKFPWWPLKSPVNRTGPIR